MNVLTQARRLNTLATKRVPCTPPAPLGYWEARTDVKGTRFIARLSPCKDLLDAKAFRQRVAEPKANHNCWVAIGKRGEALGQSDDGEPGGTAAMPMRKVLEGSGLQGVVVVITKYFGGFLSGRGGLVREYTSACKAVVDIADLQDVVPRVCFRVSRIPSQRASMLYRLGEIGADVADVSYDELGRVSAKIWVPAKSKAELLEQLPSEACEIVQLLDEDV